MFFLNRHAAFVDLEELESCELFDAKGTEARTKIEVQRFFVENSEDIYSQLIIRGPLENFYVTPEQVDVTPSEHGVQSLEWFTIEGIIRI